MKKASILLMSLSALLMLSSCREKENPVVLSDIRIYPEELDMSINETNQLTLLTVPENVTAQGVQWSSDRPNIVSVSETGQVKASGINPGNAIITARCGDKEAHCNITVKIPVQMFNFTSGLHAKSMAVGEEFAWSALYSPRTATDHDVVFEIEDPTVAELNQNPSNPEEFTVKAKKLGSTVIRAKCGGLEAELGIFVDAIKATNITLSPASVTMDPRTMQLLTATVEPSNVTNKSVVWFSSDNKIATVTSGGLVTARRPGKATISVNSGDVYAECHVTVTDNLPEGAVDLGLSVLWASSNLDNNGLCSSPEEYGAYYAWGETSTKSYYDWKTYKFRTSGNLWDEVQLSKYNTSSSFGPVDNITELQRGEAPGEKVDDVARAKLGEPWRMPTEVEIQELIVSCTCVWTTLNGKQGYKLTSRRAGYTDQWIFLPAAGYINGRLFYDSDGVSGVYWSSSLYKYTPSFAWSLTFYEDGLLRYYGGRSTGGSVRPVCD